MSRILAASSQHPHRPTPALLAAVLLAAACGGGSSAHPPLVAASVIGFAEGAVGAGFEGGASVFVLDDQTGMPVSGATVTVNGAALPYDPGAMAYQGLVAVTPGGPVAVSVAVAGRTYATTTTQFTAYPALITPVADATWSGLEAHEVTWSPGAPADGAIYALGVADATDPNGVMVWPPGDTFHLVDAPAATTSIPPGSLTAGERAVVIGIMAQRPFPGAAAGSAVFLAGFDFTPVTVEVGRPIAAAPRPAHLVLAGGLAVWGDDEAPVKAMPVTGGAVARPVSRQPVPERALPAGGFLYWIAGDELRRTTLDGVATEVLATGERGGAGSGVCTDLVVDDAAAYWVVTVPTPTCSPACEWAIQRVPLGGGPPVALATAHAEVRALAGDATTLYWEQRGMGPVSDDGNAPTDSAILAVPKAGGPATILVNGLQNGPPPVLPPGQLPASWLGVGGLALLGGDLFFGDTNFFDRYRILRVAVTGGTVEAFQEVVTGDAGDFVKGMAGADATLSWIDTHAVRAAPAAGGPAAVLASGIDEATSLAVASGLVAWTETTCCAIRQNGTLRAVPAGGGAPSTLADQLDHPSSLSSDGATATWVEGGVYGLLEGYGRIARVPLAGGTTTTVLSALVADRPRLASDGTWVFLADGTRVKRAPLVGGPLERAIAGEGSILDLATDGQHVFALDGAGTLLRAPVAGGAQVVLATGTVQAAAPLRVGGGRAYWLEQGALRSVDVAGGPVTTLATGLPALSDLVVGPASVLFAEQASGAIREVPSGGGTPLLLAAGLPAPTVRLATDGTHLWWIDPLHLGRVTLADGSALVIGTGLSADPEVPGEVAADATALYWTEPGRGAVMRSEVR